MLVQRHHHFHSAASYCDSSFLVGTSSSVFRSSVSFFDTFSSDQAGVTCHSFLTLWRCGKRDPVSNIFSCLFVFLFCGECGRATLIVPSDIKSVYLSFDGSLCSSLLLFFFFFNSICLLCFSSSPHYAKTVENRVNATALGGGSEAAQRCAQSSPLRTRLIFEGTT